MKSRDPTICSTTPQTNMLVSNYQDHKVTEHAVSNFYTAWGHNKTLQGFEFYQSFKDVVWCKEEPKDIGSLTFAVSRLGRHLSDVQKLSYTGCQASAFPAAGQKRIHLAEQNRLIGRALEKE